MEHRLKMAEISLSDAYSMAQERAQRSGRTAGSPVLDIGESLLAAQAAALIAQAEQQTRIADALEAQNELLRRVAVSTSHHVFLMDEEPERAGPDWEAE